MFDRVGKAAIPMLFFAGIPFLFAGPMIGIICWLLAVILLILLFTPVRGWLGITPSTRRSSEVTGRIGVDAAPGSYTNVSKATFGEGLDTAIKNEGEVDASEADFK